MLSAIVSGVVTGLLYGMVGLGLVVVYRASKVMNFAMGGMGVVVAYLASDMLKEGVPYWVVLPVAVVIGALLGGLIERLIVYPMRRQSHIAIALGTLGALLALEGAVGWRYGFSPSSLTPVLADAGSVEVLGVGFSANRIFIIAVALVATVLLLWIVERTRFGLGMRAASSGPLTAELLGVDTGKVRLSAWLIGGAYGCLAAMLVIPLTYLSPTSFTTFLLTAFAAVVLGGLTNIVGVVVGAVLFGVAINLMTVYVQSGLRATYTFIGVALVLVLRPHGLFGRAEKEISEPRLRTGGARKEGRGTPTARSTGGVPLLWRCVGWGVLVVAAALVPSVASESDVFLVATLLASFVGVLGLNVVAGFSGQVSLANSAMVAIGAYTAAYAVNHGTHLVLALVLATLAGAAAGLLVGLPASRLSGIYLVMFTLMFAFAVPELVLQFEGFTGGAFGVPIFSETYATSYQQYWLVFVAALIAAGAVMLASATSLGRSWRAVRDSEAGARSLGYGPMQVKLSAFVFGNGLVGLSGGLSGLLIGYIGPESFTVFIAIYALLAVVLGGPGSVFGSLIGAAFITLVPRYATSGTDLPAPLVFGVVLVLAMIFAPSGLAPMLEKAVVRLAALVRRRGAPVVEAPVDGPVDGSVDGSVAAAGSADVVDRVELVEPEPDAPGLAAVPTGDALLRLDRVQAGYEAGLVLRDISLTVGPGEVVALLGANGAGKSTVLRAISGLIPVHAGSVEWCGQLVRGRGLKTPHDVARSGVGHVPEGRGIFPDLTVDENLRMGDFARAGAAEGERDAVLDMFPILGERLRQRAGTLSGGQQQMLAIGRALVGRPRLLMLDEPSLGLAPVISAQVFEKLREIADTGVSVLLVEQNARAALDLADRGYVIQRGRIALEGSAAALRDNDQLSDSYLAVH